MRCTVHALNELSNYRYVVTLSEYQGKILLSRHRERTTWETQGGHIEPNETPLEAAKRELWEESGATDYTIEPLCDYWAGDEEGEANGMVFVAHIKTLGAIPPEEEAMEEVRLFDTLPENLTYPDITPKLFARWDEVRG